MKAAVAQPSTIAPAFWTETLNVDAREARTTCEGYFLEGGPEDGTDSIHGIKCVGNCSQARANARL